MSGSTLKRAGDARIQYLGISFSREDKGEGENRFIGLYGLKPLGRLPEEVFLCPPYIEKMTPTSPKRNNPIIEKHLPERTMPSR